GALLAVVAVGAALLYAYERWGVSTPDPRNDLLAQLPAGASAVLYIDMDALRQSPFLAELYKWAPQSKVDAEYAQFLQSTGFNYESDLHRVGIAVFNHDRETMLYAVADGRFDRKKISAYASRTGAVTSRNGKEVFSLPISGSSRQITFMFLRGDRIALTNGDTLDPPRSQLVSDSDTQAWRERFRRLAGSPAFAVMRQDGAAGSLYGDQAPRALQSPQLSSLLNQLQWFTVAGKPDSDRLHVVLEGEGAAEAPARQLSEVLNGLLVLAQAGLNDPKMRQQLQPE